MTTENGNMNYEKAVLCAVLEAPECLIVVRPLVQEDDFQDARHRKIWAAVTSLMDAHQRPDPVRVNGLIGEGVLTVSKEYVQELRDYLPSIGEYSDRGAPSWARMVGENGKCKRLFNAVNKSLQRAAGLKDSNEMASEIIAAVMKQSSGVQSEGFRWWGDIEKLHSVFDDMEDETIPTGFRDLDYVLGGGVRKSHLIILGGRPGTMKSAWSYLFAKNVAERATGDQCVAFVSMEMTARDLVMRGACTEVRFDMSRLNDASPRDLAELKRARDYLLTLPIHIFEDITTTEQLRFQIMKLAALKDIQLIVVDYAELFQDKSGSEELRVRTIFGAMKQIAKSHNIPVLVLSQLNRELEHSVSKLPGPASLRYGGDADADVVLLTYYPYMYQQRGEEVLPPPEYGFQLLDGRDDELTLRINRSSWWLVIGKGRYNTSKPIRFAVAPEFTLIKDYDHETARTGVVKLGKGKYAEDF